MHIYSEFFKVFYRSIYILFLEKDMCCQTVDFLTCMETSLLPNFNLNSALMAQALVSYMSHQSLQWRYAFLLQHKP